nr:methyl-accepting chemotaxis protein [Ruminiclostridium sp.]
MSDLFKRLGTKIILLAVTALAVTVALVLTTSMLMFSGFNDSVIMERASVGVGVLQSETEGKMSDIRSSFSTWSGQSSFISAMTFNTTEFFQESWKTIGAGAGYFCALANPRGTDMFRSDNYPFTSLNLAAIAKGEMSYDGVVFIDGKLALIHAEQVAANGVYGGLVVGFNLDSEEWLDSLKKLTDCDVTIFRGNTRYSTTIVDPSTGDRDVGTAMSESIEREVINDGKDFNGTATIVGRPYYVAYRPMKDMTGKIIGAFFAGSDATTVRQQFAYIILISLAIAVVALLVTCFMIFVFVRRNVVRPVKEVSVIADELVEGRLSSTAVYYKFNEDEIGTFANKLRDSKLAMSVCINDISGILSNMAQGDFTAEPSVHYPGEFETIKQDILTIESELGAALTNMGLSSDEVLSGSGQMAEGSQSLADGTTKQAAAVQQISATIADVTSKVALTAENAAKAGMISRETAEEVNRQDEAIASMVAAMEDINNTSKQIEKIIKTIEDISFQTNILALNAAVEAARAGDAGKGFAVVADEVRNLANKYAEAAKSTNALISAAVSAVDNGSRIAADTAEAMKKVKAKTAETGELIVMIAEASAEQRESISEINRGIEQVSQ